MKQTDFLLLLNEEMAASRMKRNRILRFRDPYIYAQIVEQWHKLSGDLSQQQHIRLIGLIRAISCPLPDPVRLAAFADWFEAEPDLCVSVNNHSILPSPSQSRPQPFDKRHSIPWGVKQIGAPQAWKFSQGRDIRIGVVDTGADYTHPDLKGSLGSGINLMNRLLPPDDDNGHGTHICGTIAAANRSSGIVGVAPKANLHPVKAFDRNGTAYISDIILGIDWCVNNEMDIINMSFGMRERSPSLWEAVKNAHRSGVVIVASSGNDGQRATIDYPARFPYTIAVGATTKKKQVAPFSNRSRQIDIYAPGEMIYSTWLNDAYNQLSGTSMSTSHVSGAIALLLAARPGLSPAQIKRLVRSSSGLLAGGRKGNRSASGLLNALAAIRLARRTRSAERSKILPGVWRARKKTAPKRTV